jgi:GNAT superfamily N-acetyltransferase
MIKYSTKPKGIKKLSEIIIQEKLHLYWGTMSGWCRGQAGPIDMISVYYHANIPVGAMILVKGFNDQNINIGVFVKPEFRRLKFGTKLYRSAIKFGSVVPVTWKDRYDAESFYNYCESLTNRIVRV